MRARIGKNESRKREMGDRNFRSSVSGEWNSGMVNTLLGITAAALILTALFMVVSSPLPLTGKQTGITAVRAGAQTPLPPAHSIIAASAPYANDPSGLHPADSGRVVAFDGAGTLLWDVYGNAGPYQYLGISIAPAGDPNQDGITDIIAGSPWYAGTRGRVDIFSGRNGNQICGANTPAGTANNTFFGASVSGGGKMTPSSISDSVAGAPLQDNVSAGQNAGKTYVISGANCSFPFADLGQNPDDHFGKTVLGGKGMDLDGDGLDDYLSHAIQFVQPYSRIGNVYAMSSAAHAPIWNLMGDVSNPANPESYFGHSMAMIGDIDSDGTMDFVIGAPSGVIAGTHGQLGTGWVTLVSGRTGTKISRIQGENPSDLFGFSVAGAGDNDHDGLFEFAVGAPNYPAGGTQGKIYMYETDGQGNAALLWSKFGENAGDNFGFSMAGVKNPFLDGQNALVASAPYFDGLLGVNVGKIYLFNPLTGNSFWTREGLTNGGNAGYLFGYSVSGTPVFG